MSTAFSWLQRNKVNLSILLSLVFLAYFNALTNGFVSDDRALVLEAPSWDLGSVFSQVHYSLRLFLYFFLYKIGGLSAFLFHFSNVFFHALNVVLVYVLLKNVQPKAAFFASALFAVHPILTESVTWVSGGVYPQYTFFFLISFITYLWSKRDRKWLILSSLSLILSVLSSEKALPLFLILILYEVLFGSIKKAWSFLLPHILIIGGFGLYFLTLLSSRTQSITKNFYGQSGNYNPLEQIPTAIFGYLKLTFWPDSLSLYQTDIVSGKTVFIFAAALVLIVFGLMLYGLFKNRQIFFWSAFTLITLLPVLTPLKIAWVVAERYFYLGSLGVFVLVSLIAVKVSRKEKYKTLVYLVFALIISLLLIRTVVRNMDWKNEDSLWLAAGRVSPSSHQNRNNLGDYYSRMGDYNRAVEEFTIAIALVPNYADAYHNRANSFVQLGNLDEAEKGYLAALKYNPSLWQSALQLGALYNHQNKGEMRDLYLSKALEINPNSADLWKTVAKFYYQIGEKGKAASAAEKALSLTGNGSDAELSEILKAN